MENKKQEQKFECVLGAPNFLVLLLIFVVYFGMSFDSAYAAFTKIQEFQLNPGHGGVVGNKGIAFDGVNWHIADIWRGRFQNYSSSFDYLGVTPVAGVDRMSGLTYDKNSGNLFVADTYTKIVREVTLAGVEIQQFTSDNSLVALAYDARDDTLWLASFTGIIEKRTRSGVLISSFNGGQNWSGLALDELNNTLILLEDDDTLYEFRTDGTLIGQIIATDQISENGLGLAYDSTSGKLWVTSQFGRLTIFQDVSRVPEPATMVLLGLGGVLLRQRNRR